MMWIASFRQLFSYGDCEKTPATTASVNDKIGTDNASQSDLADLSTIGCFFG